MALSELARTLIDAALEPIVTIFVESVAEMREAGCDDAAVEGLIDSVIANTPNLNPETTAYAVAKLRDAVGLVAPTSAIN